MSTPAAHPRRWWILGVVSLAQLTVVLDNTVLNVAVPSLTGSLHASTADVQWMINTYSLAQASLLLTAGSVADRYGRKRALLFGLGLFGLGSFAAAMSATPGQLILARAFMGIGGSFLMTTTLALVMQIFDGSERGKAIGAWAGVSSLGFAAGPLVGGFLLDHAWWGSIFLINVPVAAAGIIGVVCMVPESRNPQGSRPDLVGIILSVLGMVGVVWAVIAGPQQGWASSEVVLPAVGGVLLLVAFVLYERWVSHPMLDMNLFRDRSFSAAATGGVLVAFGMGGGLFLLTQQLQFILGFSPLRTGIAVAPMAGTVVVLNLTGTGARLLKRLGAGRSVSIGIPLIAAGLAALSFFAGHGYVGALVGLILIGSGVGLAMPALANSIMSAISRQRAGIGAGVNGTLQEFGASLGVAILGALLSVRFASLLPHSLDHSVSASLPTALAAAADQPQAAEVITATKQAFTSGLSTSELFGAVFVLIGGLTVGFILHRVELSRRPERGVGPAAGSGTSPVGPAAPEDHKENVQS
ncbi:MFS transporter [Kitasatospora sp. NPDC018058]|uniref:MFS transporter n=1 Tax=Kitasatospora sp. NPDC018058 TaxID=3364025 RepID=UPI0037BF76AE